MEKPNSFSVISCPDGCCSEEVYKAEEIKRNVLEAIAIILLMSLCAGLVLGMVYLYMNR